MREGALPRSVFPRGRCEQGAEGAGAGDEGGIGAGTRRTYDGAVRRLAGRVASAQLGAQHVSPSTQSGRRDSRVRGRALRHELGSRWRSSRQRTESGESGSASRAREGMQEVSALRGRQESRSGT